MQNLYAFDLTDITTKWLRKLRKKYIMFNITPNNTKSYLHIYIILDKWKNMTFSISAEQEKNDMQKHHTRTHIYKLLALSSSFLVLLGA